MVIFRKCLKEVWSIREGLAIIEIGPEERTDVAGSLGLRSRVAFCILQNIFLFIFYLLYINVILYFYFNIIVKIIITFN